MPSIADHPVPGGWTEREIAVGPHAFSLLVPADPDDFLNHLVEPRSTDQPHLADPYWAKLWPAAIDLASGVLRKATVQHTNPKSKIENPKSCLELGCGSGLVGLAALAAGFDVTFSDYVPFTVDLALENAARNGFPNATGLVLDWRQPIDRRWPLILAADVTYDRSHVEPLLNVLDAMLAPGGAAWFGDAGRGPAEAFIEQARARGWLVSLFDDHDRPVAGLELGQFRLITLQRQP
jgi:predicted nicotinamide N-methyase